MRAAALQCGASPDETPRPKEALELSLRLLSKAHRPFVEPQLRCVVMKDMVTQLGAQQATAGPTVIRVGKANGKELMRSSGAFGVVRAEAKTKVQVTARVESFLPADLHFEK